MTALLDRPRLTIELEGTSLGAALGRAVSAALVRQVLAAPAVAEIDLAEPPEDALEGVRHGQALVLRVVDGGAALFEGAIVGIEYRHDAAHGRTVRLRAYDALHKARGRRRARVLENVSAASLAREIAGELALGCEVHHEPPERARVIQNGESDLELLVRLTAEASLYPTLRDGALHLLALDGYGDELPMRLGRELHEVKVSLTSERALAKAEAVGWDASTLRAFRQTVPLARQDAFEMHDTGLGSGGEEALRLLLNHIVDGAGEAEALAQGEMDRAAALSAHAAGVAVGDPRLAPGRPIRLEGVADRAAGRYVITEAVHRFETGTGYVTEFATSPPERPVRAHGPVATVGTVLAIDDPEGLGRCRVKLGGLGDVETGWLQVLLPGAGAAKGLAVLPDPEDQVLVLFPQGDPARGFVLGGLYGERRLPRGVNVKTARPFVLRTAGGQGLELGSNAALARLSTKSGSLLELLPGRARLASATDLVIEAPGRTITIRADAVKLERG